MSVAEVQAGETGDLDAQLRERWRRLKDAGTAQPMPDHQLRRERLGRLRRLVLDNRADIIAAINADFGSRAAEETLVAEVFTTLSGIRHASAHLARWMRPRRRAVDLAFRPATARLLPQPLGVVGIISPWNYPLYLALSPLVAALAAGNRVMLKPSEVSPRTSELLARLLGRAFTTDEVDVVLGGPEVAAAFSRLPFDHLLYTGSTAVGRKVMQAAAANLTPVTLELGGKSPAIVGPGADLDRAVNSIVKGKLFNAGQTCVAPDYVLLPRPRLDAFVDKAVATARRYYPSLAGNPDYTAIINQRQYERLTALVAEAEADGARAVVANPDGESPPAEGRKLPLTLLLDTTEAMRVRREEIFGPLLPVLPYDDLAEAIALINGQDRPLALYIYDDDRAAVDRVLAETVSGGVTVNDCLLHVAIEDLPFGGVGASGMGHYHGREGFETFSKLKPVLRQSRLNGAWMLNPPYGRLAKGLIGLLLKR